MDNHQQSSLLDRLLTYVVPSILGSVGLWAALSKYWAKREHRSAAERIEAAQLTSDAAKAFSDRLHLVDGQLDGLRQQYTALVTHNAMCEAKLAMVIERHDLLRKQFDESMVELRAWRGDGTV